MLYRFNLDKELNNLYGIDARSVSPKAVRFMKKNIRSSLGETLKSVRLATPHSGDGRPRGLNMITNSLYNSWHANYSAHGSKLGFLELSNARPYAKYVQEGHRVTRHFVPWLYIGANGLLNRESNHSGRLFGLTVGVPETYVPGTDMTSGGVQTFMDAVVRSIYAAEYHEWEKEKKRAMMNRDISLTELTRNYYSKKATAQEKKEIAEIYSDVQEKAIGSIRDFLKKLFKSQ